MGFPLATKHRAGLMGPQDKIVNEETGRVVMPGGDFTESPHNHSDTKNGGPISGQELSCLLTKATKSFSLLQRDANGIPSESVDLTSATILPKGTTLQRPAATNTGAVRYNTDLGTMEVCNGSAWLGLLTSGNTISNGGNSFGSDISIGTNDAFGLNFKTNNKTGLSLTKNSECIFGPLTGNVTHIGYGSAFKFMSASNAESGYNIALETFSPAASSAINALTSSWYNDRLSLRFIRNGSSNFDSARLSYSSNSGTNYSDMVTFTLQSLAIPGTFYAANKSMMFGTDGGTGNARLSLAGGGYDNFTYGGSSCSHYGLSTFTGTGGSGVALAGYGGVSLFSAGVERINLAYDGTVTFKSPNFFAFLTPAAAAQGIKVGSLTVSDSYGDGAANTCLYVKGAASFGSIYTGGTGTISGNLATNSNLTVSGYSQLGGLSPQFAIKRMGPFNLSGSTVTTVNHDFPDNKRIKAVYGCIVAGTVSWIIPGNAGATSTVSIVVNNYTIDIKCNNTTNGTALSLSNTYVCNLYVIYEAS